MSQRSRIITLSILSVLIVGCIVLGVTYSFMQANIDSNSVTEVSLSSCAKITLEDGGDSINIENSYPVSRNKGMQSDPYTFTVTSSCESYVGFNLYLATLDTNTLSDSSIHYVITEHDSKEALVEGILSDATNALSEFNSDELNQLNIGIGGTYNTIYRLYNDSIPLQGSVTYDLYLFIDESVTNDTMNQEFRAGVAIKSYDREADSTSLALDISLGNIVIDEGSSTDTLYVSGGGLSEQTEIDNTLPIIITGSTEENGIEIYGGTSNITLSNVNINRSSGSSLGLENSAVVNLNVDGNVFLKNNFGGALQVWGSSTLFIDGDGILNASGKQFGIGGNGGGQGTIVINGGTINASIISDGSNGSGGAAIGNNFKLIEINGGSVTAIGSENYPDGTGQGPWGAGIGTAHCSSFSGEIIINGGTVYAKGGPGAAGIGAGSPYTDENIGEACIYYGQITISESANVTAIAGPGIGTPPPEDIGNAGGGG